MPRLGERLDSESFQFYLFMTTVVTGGAVIATAILWMAGRPKRPREYVGRAFEVRPAVQPAQGESDS
jgi:hypothetical protein